MLQVKYFDGFTEELVYFCASFDGEECNVVFKCFIGSLEDEKYSFIVDESKLDILDVIEVLLPMNENYEIPMDDIGSICFEVDWNGKTVRRNFDGHYISRYANDSSQKATLESIEDVIYDIRSHIIDVAKGAERL